jgi:hypothetical protein
MHVETVVFAARAFLISLLGEPPSIYLTCD